MQPLEPDRPRTSLDLTFPEHDVNPAPSGTELVLPPSDPSPPPPVPADESATAVGPLGDLVAAHFRRVEVAMLGRVLITTLSGALPASMVRVEARRSVGRRLTRRAAEPIGVTITAGEKTLTFRAPAVGEAEALVGHTVRGVVLSSSRVPVPQWLGELGDLLEQVARDDEATRNALERTLLP